MCTNSNRFQNEISSFNHMFDIFNVSNSTRDLKKMAYKCKPKTRLQYIPLIICTMLINDWTISLWWQYSRFKCCWVNSLWTIHSIDEKTKFISNKPHLCALIKAPTMVSRVFVVVLNTRYADSNYIDILYQAFFFLLWKRWLLLNL